MNFLVAGGGDDEFILTIWVRKRFAYPFWCGIEEANR